MIRQQQESELNHLRQLIEAIEESWGKGWVDEDGDYIIPEEAADRIKMLLEC